MQILVAAEQTVDIAKVHSDLCSDAEAVRDAARKRLESLHPDQLLGLLRMETSRARKGNAVKFSLWLLLQLGIVAMVILVLVLLAALTHGGDFGGCSGGWPGVAMPDSNPDSDELRAILRALVLSNHAAAPAVLLEAVYLHKMLGTQLGVTVDDRLLRVTTSDAGIWSVGARQKLLHRWVLEADRHCSIRRARGAIHAAEQVGGPEMIVALHRLTHHFEPSMCNSARNAVAVLQRRARSGTDPRELLRPAPATDSQDNGDELLRAHASTPRTEPSELLRGADSAGSPPPPERNGDTL